ncbi:MAG: hypothetical protein WHX53_14260, partial [Anaerolineae bacterium]
TLIETAGPCEGTMTMGVHIMVSFSSAIIYTFDRPVKYENRGNCPPRIGVFDGSEAARRKPLYHSLPSPAAFGGGRGEGQGWGEGGGKRRIAGIISQVTKFRLTFAIALHATRAVPPDIVVK